MMMIIIIIIIITTTTIIIIIIIIIITFLKRPFPRVQRCYLQGQKFILRKEVRS